MLKELFGRLRKARITARPTKCLLGSSRMEFLGHQVGGDVITPSCDNLEKVRNTPRPTTKKQVRSFLGLVGYYRDHIPAFAEISAPLTDLLKKGKAEHIQSERGTGVCILPFEGIPVAGASPEASRGVQAVRVMDRRIRSWCGGCDTSGKRREAISSGLRQ